MRHAFALLRTYEHNGYGSFRNLLRTLVNFNALKSADRMAYMKDTTLAQRDTRECQFIDLVLQYLVVRENPERFAMSKTIRDFMFHPERLARLPEAALPAVEAEIDAFEREIDRAYDRFARASASKGTLEALAPIIGEDGEDSGEDVYGLRELFNDATEGASGSAEDELSNQLPDPLFSVEIEKY